MKKQELRQDPIREKIVNLIGYFNSNKNRAIQIAVLLVVLIGGYSYYKDVQMKASAIAKSMAGKAQAAYNATPSDITVNDLQIVLDDYTDLPAGAQAYTYLLKDAFANSNNEKLSRLLNEYNLEIEDNVLLANILESQSNIARNNGDYEQSEIYLLKGIDKIDLPSIVFNFQIQLVDVYIHQYKFQNAKDLLFSLQSIDDLAFNDQNMVEELVSYVDQLSN